MPSTADLAVNALLVEVLSDFARTMVTEFPVQAILDRLVQQIVAVLPVDAAGVTLISPNLAPRYVAASAEWALVYEQLQSDVQEGPCLLAYTSDTAVLISDLAKESRFPRFAPKALDAGLRAAFTFPLRHGDQRLGALDLYRSHPGTLSPAMATAAQTLADVAAAYLINAQSRMDLQHTSDRAQQISLHDPLTGLPNRILMLERLTHAFQRARRTGRTSAVLFVDLDGFKVVNDHHGHAAGDRLLVAVAQRLTHLLRPSDTLARIHGDEFVLLCEDLARPGDAADICARLQAALGDPFSIGGRQIQVRASVGVAHADTGSHEPDDVLRNADLAMYEAKRRGGGQFWVYDPRYRNPIGDYNHLQSDLRAALTEGRLENHYQPIVSTGSGEVVSFEALLRWSHPRRGAVPPATFLPVAERAGLTGELEGLALTSACADHHAWTNILTAAGRWPTVGVSVNVSTLQLMTSGLVDTVVAALAHNGTDPAQLTVEITESVFIQDAHRALQVLNDLKDVGVRIALDDFGTGYSSLSYLNQFPVDIVKIDRSFIQNLGDGSVDRIITAAVIELAHSLSMTVVAEGIETLEQHQQVRELGCDFSQGYIFARPMNSADVAGYLRDHTTAPPIPEQPRTIRDSTGSRFRRR